MNHWRLERLSLEREWKWLFLRTSANHQGLPMDVLKQADVEVWQAIQGERRRNKTDWR
jgi:antitoxin component of RelBE/YafQ-DinJ toxin-antitoxin module